MHVIREVLLWFGSEMSPRSSCAEGFISSLWHHWECVETLGCAAWLEEVGYWGHDFDGYNVTRQYNLMKPTLYICSLSFGNIIMGHMIMLGKKLSSKPMT